MKKSNPAQIVSIGGILAALAVLFHSSPVFLPGVGMLLSPLATLPIAIAAAISALTGVTALLSSSLILLFISPQEAAIFLLATGSLGLALGASISKSVVFSAAISGSTLFIGINILTYAAGIPVFGDKTPSGSAAYAALIFMLFSICYSVIWLYILKFIMKILKSLGLINIDRNSARSGQAGHKIQ